MSLVRPRLAAPLVAAALLASGCGMKPEPVGSIPSFPQTVGDGSSLIGASGRETSPSAARRLPVVVDGSGRPLVRKLRRLHPDLILAPASLSADAAAQLSHELGAAVYVSGPPTVQGIEHDIDSVAVLTGYGARGGQLVGEMQARIGAIRRAVSGTPPVRVFVDNGFFYTIDPSSPTAQLIQMAGGVDVATDAQPGRPYPLAKLRAAAPQAYLAVAGRSTTLSGLRTSKATRNLPAVRSGRFLLIDERDLTDPGLRVVTTLRQIAHLLHPTAHLPGS